MALWRNAGVFRLFVSPKLSRNAHSHVIPLFRDPRAMDKQQKFDLAQRRKHAPRLPSSLRLKKRVLVLDRPEDIGREMEKLQTQTGNASPAVLQSHWRSLMHAAYADLFGERKRKRSPVSVGRQKSMAHLGMPMERHTQVINPERLQQLKDIFRYLDKHFSLTVQNYTTMMNTYERIGEPEKSVALYEKMKDQGLKPDLMCYNSVIKSFGAMQNSFEAVRVLDDMKDRQVLPDVVTYTNLIHIFARERDVDAMLSMYRYLEQYEIQPTVVTVAVMVDGLCKARRLREALQIFQEARAQGVKPNDFAYNALISGVARKGDTRLAVKCLHEMAADGVKPNFMTFKAMVNAIVVAGKYNDLLDLHTALTRGEFGDLTPSDRTYDLVLNAMGNSQNPDLYVGLELFKEATSNGFFKDITKLGQDRFCVNFTNIGVVPFIVNAALHSYIDRTYAPAGRVPLEGVAPRGVVFICGSPAKKEPKSEVQIKHPEQPLLWHMAQETSTTHMRVEAELQAARIPYRVIENEKDVRVVVETSTLKHWVMGWHRIFMATNDGSGYYVYKPGVRVDRPAHKYGQVGLSP